MGVLDVEVKKVKRLISEMTTQNCLNMLHRFCYTNLTGMASCWYSKCYPIRVWKNSNLEEYMQQKEKKKYGRKVHPEVLDEPEATERDVFVFQVYRWIEDIL